MRYSIFVIAAVLLTVLTMNANATPISFVQTGLGSGSFLGTPFSDTPFIINAVGDTSTIHWDPRLGTRRGHQINLVSASITVGDGWTTTFPREYTQFVVRNDLQMMFFDVTGPDGWTLLTGPSSSLFADWDMLTSIGPVTGESSGGFRYPLYGEPDGQLIFSLVSPMTFSATVQPVPEPGTLILLAAGFLGLAIYCRHAKSI
jgi:hypothetical protein